MVRSLCVGVVALGGLLAAAVRADDWPEFRGPTGQGVVPKGRLPVEWGPEKNVAWKKAIPGLGWSSPIIWKDRLFLTTAVPGRGKSDQSLRVLCLDVKTGKTLWDEEVIRQEGKSAPGIHKKNSHASPTPVTDGERVYAHFGHQGTACVDFNGKRLWKRTDLRYAPVHGNGGSPILVGETLVYSADGSDQQFVVALDRRNGETVWKTDRKTDAERKFSFSTPLHITVNGRGQIVSPGSDVVCAYDPKDGAELWRVRYQGYSVVPRPAFGQGLVFVCAAYDDPELLAIRPEGKGDITKTHVAWRSRKGVPLDPSPLVAGRELYLVSNDGRASCLDARTGKVHWQMSLGGNFSASPLYGDGKVYFQDEDGVGTVVKGGTKYELLARNDLKEKTLASYAAADGALFIRTEKHLYRIQERVGAPVAPVVPFTTAPGGPIREALPGPLNRARRRGR